MLRNIQNEKPKIIWGNFIMKKENVINQEQLAEWKKEFGHIYKTTIGEETVIWRKLRRKEYVEAMTQDIDNPATKIFARQDYIVKTVTLFPANIEEIIEESGGFSGSIADEILLKSGFDVSETEEL